MSSKDILIAVLVITLCVTSASIYGDYLQNMRDTRLTELRNEDQREVLQHLSFVSEQETERAKLLTEVRDYPLDACIKRLFSALTLPSCNPLESLKDSPYLLDARPGL